MHDVLASVPVGLAATGMIASIVGAVWPIVLIFLGFSAVIFVHELGHFLVAKACGIRVEKFAIGFFREIVGFTRGETRYSFNLLPLGGYVKMLGQEDFDVDKSGELRVKEDPRSFTNKTVGQRMAVVSAGVVMNILFAGLLFMIVFMVGKRGYSTEIGYVRPNWPAAMAGLEPGDVIQRIDGRTIEEWSEVNFATMLAAPLEPLDFEVLRRGERKLVQLTPLNNEDEGLLQIGVGPALTRTIVAVGPTVDQTRPDTVHAGDVIVEVNGREVTDENASEAIYMLMSTPTEVANIVVERAVSDDPDAAPERANVVLQPQFGLYPSDPKDRLAKHAHLLGLTPLTKVASVTEGGRAWLGGLKAGDIILKWGEQQYPTYGDISKSINENGETDIHIVVLRDGRHTSAVVRPKVKQRIIMSPGRPQIDAELNLNATDVLRIGAVAETIDGHPSPAAAAGLPPGALITQVNGEPVSNWLELIERFRAGAGTTLTLTYDHKQQKGATCQFHVPHTIRTLLGLPAYSRISAIDGEETVMVELFGRMRRISVSSPYGLRETLKRRVGDTVVVTYAESPFAESRTAELAVTADMVDPWLGRILYQADVTPSQAAKLIKKGPVGALAIGARKTAYFVFSVYTTMERMIFSRSLGVENLSGPVGIVKIGRRVAGIGMVELLYFLAMISANLAVINFLPLPIVDGGLMVFLGIEKIKGSPVNLKVQMATQVIGLILIGTAFVLITILDFTK